MKPNSIEIATLALVFLIVCFSGYSYGALVGSVDELSYRIKTSISERMMLCSAYWKWSGKVDDTAPGMEDLCK